MIFTKKQTQPTGTEEMVKIEDIIIPTEFIFSHPSPKKYKEYEERYIKLGYLDKPITVVAETNEKGEPNRLVLVNGYIRYQIADDWNFDEVPIKYKYIV